MSQFSAIRTYAASRFRDQNNTIVADTDWKNYVNSVYGNVLITMPHAAWNEASTTLTINAGQRTAQLPTDAWRVLAVWNSVDLYPMIPLEGRDQVYLEYPQQNEVGAPLHYRVFGQLLEVYPLPQLNTTFTVEYQVQAPDMVNDTDVPIFPSQYHDMLVVGAVAMAYRDDGNLQMATQYDGEFEGMLKALQIEAAQPRQSRYYEIVDGQY